MRLELVNQYNDIQTKIEALRQQAKQYASEILHEGTRKYFEKHGHLVEAISWLQYTPYFNDGESCEFSVHEPYAFYRKLVVLEDDEEDFEYNEDSKYLFSEEDFDEDKLNARIEERRKFDSNPLAWATAKAEEYNSRIVGSYRYSPQYFLDYPPECLTEQELLVLKERVDNTYPDIVEETEALLSVIGSMDEQTMKELFGDHVRVIITRDGVTIEDHHHE
jgi:hypothetical protein